MPLLVMKSLMRKRQRRASYRRIIEVDYYDIDF